jgi:hypothetical protein
MIKYLSKTPRLFFMLVFALLISCSHIKPLTNQQFNPVKMDCIVSARDGRGFILTPSGKPFVPWGLNYGNRGRLIEDYWENEWQTVVDDFRKMKAMGAVTPSGRIQKVKIN